METATTSTTLAQVKVHCPRTQGFHKAGRMDSHNSCLFPFLVCFTSSRGASFPVSLSGKKISESLLSSPSRPKLSAALGTGRSRWELRDPGTGLPHTAWPLPPAQSSTGEQAPQDSAGPGLSAFELQRKHESLTVYQFKAGLQLPGAGLSPPPDNYTRSNAITGPTFYIKQEGPS